MQTRTRRLLWTLVLLHTTGRVASAKDVRVEVMFGGPRPSRTLEALAVKEAAVIWGAYGVDVDAPRPRGCEPLNAVRLNVTFGDGPERGMAAASLGSIRFLDGVPEPAIVLYPHVVAALVSAVPWHSILDSQGAVRDFILGRALGRALAHEIGHFLLRSQLHSTDGLMRACQPAADLVDPSRHRFELSRADVTRLAAATSSLDQPLKCR